MSNQKVVALLDENDVIVNTIVVDDNTPENFLSSLISDTDFFANVKDTERIDHLKIKPALGWTRTNPGKYDAPVVVEPEPDPDVIADVLADDRLGVLDSAQKAVLEDVLTDYISPPN